MQTSTLSLALAPCVHSTPTTVTPRILATDHSCLHGGTHTHIQSRRTAIWVVDSRRSRRALRRLCVTTRSARLVNKGQSGSTDAGAAAATYRAGGMAQLPAGAFARCTMDTQPTATTCVQRSKQGDRCTTSSGPPASHAIDPTPRPRRLRRSNALDADATIMPKLAGILPSALHCYSLTRWLARVACCDTRVLWRSPAGSDRGAGKRTERARASPPTDQCCPFSSPASFGPSFSPWMGHIPSYHRRCPRSPTLAHAQHRLTCGRLTTARRAQLCGGRYLATIWLLQSPRNTRPGRRKAGARALVCARPGWRAARPPTVTRLLTRPSSAVADVLGRVCVSGDDRDMGWLAASLVRCATHLHCGFVPCIYQLARCGRPAHKRAQSHAAGRYAAGCPWGSHVASVPACGCPRCIARRAPAEQHLRLVTQQSDAFCEWKSGRSRGGGLSLGNSGSTVNVMGGSTSVLWWTHISRSGVQRTVEIRG